jgi:glutamyl-tRNA reductase
MMKIGIRDLTETACGIRRSCFDPRDGRAAELKKRFSQAEFLLIPTCANELKQVPRADIDKLAEFLQVSNVDQTSSTIFYAYEDEDAVRHLLTAASSLDSLVVGECR